MANEAKKIKETTFENTKLSTVKLNWKEVYYTNCPLVSASNVDQELGWTRGIQEDRRQVRVPALDPRERLVSALHPQPRQHDPLRRPVPAVQVHADIRRTRLLGVTHVPREGGVMMVRAKDDIYRMADLKGKKIGLSKSMNRVRTTGGASRSTRASS